MMGSAHEHVTVILRELGARAAGYWRLDGGLLALEAFVPCDDMSEDVASAFTEATREVPLALTSLSIVQTALDGEPVIARAADLPPEFGSGRWLRAFGAARSVAVPVRDGNGAVQGVFSVALAGDLPEDRVVAAHLVALANRHFRPSPSGEGRRRVLTPDP